MSSTKRKTRGIRWPDKAEWKQMLLRKIQENPQAMAACHRLKLDGCIDGNVLSFLQGYTFASTTVLVDRAQKRDRVLQGLKGMSGRIDRAADAMQRLCEVKWHGEQTFGEYLKELTYKAEMHPVNGGDVIDAELPPIFVSMIPEALRQHSRNLDKLRIDLKSELSPRKVGKAVYLAEFATYLELLTKKPVPWGWLAELVNVARPEGFKEQQADGNLLRKNYNNFISSNPPRYEQIRKDIVAYLADCAELPPRQQPTLVRWTLDRRKQKAE